MGPYVGLNQSLVFAININNDIDRIRIRNKKTGKQIMLKQHQLAKKRHAKKLKRKNKKYDPSKYIELMMQKQAGMVQNTEQTVSNTLIVDK